jgi:hypothetical protein
VDEINTGDLTIHISIPLTSKSPYGPAAATSLDMDSRSYRMGYGGGYGPQVFTGPNFQFHSSAQDKMGPPPLHHKGAVPQLDRVFLLISEPSFRNFQIRG